MTPRHLLRIFLIAVCVLVTVGAAMNVFADNADVRSLAEETACGPRAPACVMTRMERTPLHQSFDFTTKQNATYTVVCSRSAVLFGAYACAKE
jgi:hypothetical protein